MNYGNSPWPWPRILGMVLSLIVTITSIICFVFTRTSLLNGYIDDLGYPIYGCAGLSMIIAINYMIYQQSKTLIVLVLMIISLIFWLVMVIMFTIQNGTGCKIPPGQIFQDCGQMKELFICMIITLACLLIAMGNYIWYKILPMVKQGGFKALLPQQNRGGRVVYPPPPIHPQAAAGTSYPLQDYSYQQQPPPPPGYAYQPQPGNSYYSTAYPPPPPLPQKG
ncbi:uncharacterized protein J8A68_004022 [[Candida] subhashii]|uniref:MARVEL domain-containing protein n=1 Tax=[Candida] subhashii TaxID=561895 RepID=A0A8J5UL13_9ASCO|nr:uncharacterized protein J8A68_004022 [[Candida] subhashii]KAG7662491.1 hypothetical protein J8A68_004022 [[Candida] subhashii]